MSKTVSKLALAAGIVLAIAFTFSCSNTQVVDNEKRILGTWVDEEDGSTWVFNPDKTGTQNGNDKFGETFKYGTASDKLAIIIDYQGYRNKEKKTFVLGLSISNDGKTAILTTALAEGSLYRKKD